MKKVFRSIIAFLLGIVTPYPMLLLTLPFYLLLTLITYSTVSVLGDFLYIGMSKAMAAFLGYAWFSMPLLVAPSINALLFGFNNKNSPGKFSILVLQMLAYIAIEYPQYSFFPLCYETQCEVWLWKNTLSFLSYAEQSYIETSSLLLLGVSLLIGCYIGMSNPIATIFNKIQSLFKKQSENSIPPNFQLKDSKPPWLLWLPVSWIVLLTCILVTGLLCLPISHYAWAVPENQTKTLKVYINPHPQKEALYKESYRLFILDAMWQWEIASKGLFRFKLVQDKKESDIYIDWKAFNVNNLMDLSHLGLTMPELEPPSFDYIRQVSMEIKTQNVPDNVVHKVLIHEFGHALGLPHTSNSKDMMYESAIPDETAKNRLLSKKVYHPKLTEGDLEAFTKTYPSLEEKAPLEEWTEITRKRYEALGLKTSQ